MKNDRILAVMQTMLEANYASQKTNPAYKKELERANSELRLFAVKLTRDPEAVWLGNELAKGSVEKES